MCQRNILGILLFAIILAIVGTAGAECKKAGDDCHFQIGSNECDSDVCKTGLSCSVMNPSQTSSATCQPAKMKPFTLGLGGLIPGGNPFGGNSSTGGSTCQQKPGEICTESTPCCPGMTCSLVTSGQNAGFKICVRPPNEQFVNEMTNAFAIPMMVLMPLHSNGEHTFLSDRLRLEIVSAIIKLTTQIWRRYPCFDPNNWEESNFRWWLEGGDWAYYMRDYVYGNRDMAELINYYRDGLRARLDPGSDKFDPEFSCVNNQ
jgi:hypothetical protein